MKLNRRSFFSWSAAGAAALCSAAGVCVAAVMRFLSPSVFYEPPLEFKIGNPEDFAFGPPTYLPGEKIFVFRNQERGFSVVSAVCTHLGCDVQWFNNDRRFHCPCHGSIFAAEGEVVHGPAPRPLDWFEVTEAKDGQLMVDKSHAVPASYHLIVKA